MSETKQVMCYECDEEILDIQESEEWQGDMYHSSCLEEVSTVCDRCDERVNRDETHSLGWSVWCDSCAERHGVNCTECGELMERGNECSYDGEDYCEYHYDQLDRDEEEEEESDSLWREWSSKKLPEHMDGKKGKYITSKRIFSAEVECYYPAGDALKAAAKELPRSVGVESDGSLNNRGVEFQTPMLQGKAGEETINSMCEILNRHEFTVNASAGLHVHLDAEGLMPKNKTKAPPTALRTLMLLYLVYEDVLLSFLPPSRRGNRYCDMIGKNFNVREIRQVATLDDLEKIWYRETSTRAIASRKSGKYDESRYNGVNMHSLLKDGHLEIRYHSGTLNAQKILEWVNLHQTILDMCVPKKEERVLSYEHYEDGKGRLGIREITGMVDIERINTDRLVKAMSITNMEEKTASLFELLDLPARARKYFTERQKTFTSNSADKTEAANLNEVCAA